MYKRLFCLIYNNLLLANEIMIWSESDKSLEDNYNGVSVVSQVRMTLLILVLRPNLYLFTHYIISTLLNKYGNSIIMIMYGI